MVGTHLFRRRARQLAGGRRRNAGVPQLWRELCGLLSRLNRLQRHEGRRVVAPFCNRIVARCRARALIPCSTST